jgi:glc operon protein GlcG
VLDAIGVGSGKTEQDVAVAEAGRDLVLAAGVRQYGAEQPRQ